MFWFNIKICRLFYLLQISYFIFYLCIFNESVKTKHSVLDMNILSHITTYYISYMTRMNCNSCEVMRGRWPSQPPHILMAASLCIPDNSVSFIHVKMYWQNKNNVKTRLLKSCNLEQIKKRLRNILNKSVLVRTKTSILIYLLHGSVLQCITCSRNELVKCLSNKW